MRQDRKAQKTLYDRYAPAAYGIIRRYVSDGQAAGEILNDAFYKVFTKLDQYGFQGAFEGWIRRITLHAITDHMRRYVKHDQVQQVDIEKTDIYVDNDQVGRLTYKELLAVVHTLPDTQRTVFNLYVFEQYPHKDIATQLNITENNSRWHLNDARRRLKEKLKTIMQ